MNYNETTKTYVEIVNITYFNIQMLALYANILNYFKELRMLYPG